MCHLGACGAIFAGKCATMAQQGRRVLLRSFPGRWGLPATIERVSVWQGLTLDGQDLEKFEDHGFISSSFRLGADYPHAGTGSLLLSGGFGLRVVPFREKLLREASPTGPQPARLPLCGESSGRGQSGGVFRSSSLAEASCGFIRCFPVWSCSLRPAFPARCACSGPCAPAAHPA